MGAPLIGDTNVLYRATTRRARRHGRSRRGTEACVGAAARRPVRVTARATPTPTARNVIPARSRGNGRANGCAKRCGPGTPATAAHPPPMTGPSHTRAGAGQTHSAASKTPNGRRRARQARFTAAGQPHVLTPSRMPESQLRVPERVNGLPVVTEQDLRKGDRRVDRHQCASGRESAPAALLANRGTACADADASCFGDSAGTRQSTSGREGRVQTWQTNRRHRPARRAPVLAGRRLDS
jgi:hypothetical protein